MQGRGLLEENNLRQGREGVLEPQFCKEMSFLSVKMVTALSVLLADLYRVRGQVGIRGRGRRLVFGSSSNFSFLIPDL